MPIRYGDFAPRLAEGPLDWSQIIDGQGDVELEIGFGRGGFLIERAQVVPTHRLVGIEIKSKWAFKVDERRKKLELSSARAFCGDAREILARSGPDGSLARVFVHFPDPWWKKRHVHRRVLDDALLLNVARLLRIGGELFVQTDVEDRALMLVDQLRAISAFGLEGDARGFVSHNPYGARSNREVRAEQDGLPIYRVVARRR